MKIYNLLILFCFTCLQAQQDLKVGLVLSGGGAKGYAHIAVLKELEKANVRIDYIGGTSMGAIIGGLYAAGYSADQLDSLVHNMNLNDLIFNFKDRKNLPMFDKTYKENYVLDIPFDNFKLNLPNAISNSGAAYLYLNELLISTHDIKDFSKLPIPFFCIATNLETGKEKIFEKGFLPKSVMASGALPSLIEPVQIGDSLYVDGGVVNNFPAQEMRTKAVDLIIGVELGQAFKTRDEINNVGDILVQISNFSIKEKVAKQKEYVDILINPDLREYTTTSFNDYDNIYRRGVQEANKFKEVFRLIADKQQNYQFKRKDMNPYPYCITNIEVKGSESYNSDYIKGKLGFDSNEVISASEINQGMTNLLQTKNFHDVDYQLHNSPEGYELQLKLKENTNKLSAKLGVHYDKIYSTGILLNLSTRNFIFKNTSASLDVVVGDRIRYYLNIFGDNGIKPSMGFQSKYINSPIKISTTNNSLNYVDYNIHWLYNTFYIQSTLKERYAIGLGLDHDYSLIRSNSLNDNNPEQTLVNSFYLSPKTFIRMDTQDNPNFPKKGITFHALLKYAAFSNQRNFIQHIQLQGSADIAFTIGEVFTLRQNVFMGIQGNNRSFIYNYMFGGINRQNMLYFRPFMGYDYASFYAENAIALSTQFQLNIFKNNYLLFTGNVANIGDRIEELRFFKYKQTGVGIGYGYDSPIGPIILNYGYSSQIKKNLVTFTLGYWF